MLIKGLVANGSLTVDAEVADQVGLRFQLRRSDQAHLDTAVCLLQHGLHEFGCRAYGAWRPEEVIDNKAPVNVIAVLGKDVIEFQAGLARPVPPVVLVLDERNTQVSLCLARRHRSLIDGSPGLGLREAQFLTEEFVRLPRDLLQTQRRLPLENGILPGDLPGKLPQLFCDQLSCVAGGGRNCSRFSGPAEDWVFRDTHWLCSDGGECRGSGALSIGGADRSRVSQGETAPIGIQGRAIVAEMRPSGVPRTSEMNPFVQ